jgi:tRNA dimethylallyltransferase
MNKAHKIVAIVGPTACGKTDIAIELANKFGAEIINCDSRQVYRRLAIGTAKPTVKEQAAARHHLIDVVDPDETYTAAKFVQDAETAIDEITARGKKVLIVGGTGFYLRALTDGLFECEVIDPEIREELDEKVRELGSEAVHAELAAIDPESARKIHPNDAMRIVRALEVHRSTGKPISRLRQEQTIASPHRFLIIGLEHERKILYNRINMRTDRMIEAGLVEEVKHLLATGCDRSFNALQTIGYKQIIDHLDGKLTLEQAAEEIRKNTRRYAKRQLTWFNSTRGLEWLPPGEQIIERVSRFWD